jgi:hypothetical protein
MRGLNGEMLNDELTRGANNDIMNEPRESSNEPENLALERGQQEFLRGGDGSCRCPSINYEPVTSTDSENRVNKAFDVLFQEVMNIRKSK